MTLQIAGSAVINAVLAKSAAMACVLLGQVRPIVMQNSITLPKIQLIAVNAAIYAMSMKSVRPVRAPQALGIPIAMENILIHPITARIAANAGLFAHLGKPVATAVV